MTPARRRWSRNSASLSAAIAATFRALCAGLWRLHLTATWAPVPVADVTPQLVRAWHDAAATTTGPTALAQSYRLLRAVLQVAVTDEVIAANPCRLRGAATPRAARPGRALTAAEIHTLAAAVPARYRVLVLTLAFGGLLFGEATALRRRDVTRDGKLIAVGRSVRYLQGEWVLGPPKSEAGRRTVALPEFVADEMVRHLDEHVAADDDGLVFGTRSGHFLNDANSGSAFRRAVARCGRPPVRVHELRHTGATLAAATGASTAELMRRFGHSSPTLRSSTSTPPPTATPKSPAPSTRTPPGRRWYRYAVARVPAPPLRWLNRAVIAGVAQ